MVSRADLKKTAEERRIDLNAIPEELFEWPIKITDLYSQLKRGKEIGVSEDGAFSSHFGYFFQLDLQDSEIIKNLSMSYFPSNLRGVNELRKNENAPLSLSEMERRVSWIFPFIKHKLTESGLEENVRGYKYDLLELVYGKVGEWNVHYVFLGDYSLAALKALSKAYPPKDLNRLLASYLNERVERYTLKDGVTPKKGEAKRIEFLTEIRDSLLK